MRIICWDGIRPTVCRSGLDQMMLSEYFTEVLVFPCFLSSCKYGYDQFQLRSCFLTLTWHGTIQKTLVLMFEWWCIISNPQQKMMRQVTTSDFCMNSRPSCLAEDSHHPTAHFDLCTSQASKFYPPPPPSSLQMTLAPMALPTQSHKPMVCQRQEVLGGDPRSSGKLAGLKNTNQATDDAKKKNKSVGKTGRRGRPLGTTKLAGYRTSTGRPLGTTRAAGFKTSPGRPLGTTRAAGYKVSPGRPPGSIKGLSRLNKLVHSSTCSGAAFPYPLPHKEILCEPSCKEKPANE